MRRGVALIAVLLITLLLEGVVVGVAMLTVAELDYVAAESDYVKAYNNAVSGMTIAQIVINTSPYQNNRNVRLMTAANRGTPVAYEDGKFAVFVEQPNDYPELWYILHAYGYSGDVTSEIIIRVREHDYFSRWNLYADRGQVTVSDPNRWTGRVHSNHYLGFRDETDTPMNTEQDMYDFMGNSKPKGSYPLAARFYDAVTVANPVPSSVGAIPYCSGYVSNPVAGLYDYWEHGGVREALFKVPPREVDRISMPPITSMSELGQKVRAGGNLQEIPLHYGGQQVGTLYKSDRGISVVRSAGAEKIFMLITLQGDKVKIDLDYDYNGDGESDRVGGGWSRDKNLYSGTFNLGQKFIIHNTDDIVQLHGDLKSRVTVASEKGEVLITGDIMYYDDDGNPVISYTPVAGESPEAEINPEYHGNACLGVMARSNIYLANTKGDDDNLVICGVFAGGVDDDAGESGDDLYDGSVSWLVRGISRSTRGDTVDSYVNYDDLVIFGSIIADANRSNKMAHWRGYSSGGGYREGSLLIYDQKLRVNPPPSFAEVNMPLYAAWQLIR